MLLVIITLLLVIRAIEGASIKNMPLLGANCTTSYECGEGACCRDASGHVLTDESEGFPIYSDDKVNIGTCSRELSREGEQCDSNCGCKPGLECYRPVTGMCCTPMICYNVAYVRKQRKYWENCFSDPNCFFPA